MEPAKVYKGRRPFELWSTVYLNLLLGFLIYVSFNHNYNYNAITERNFIFYFGYILLAMLAFLVAIADYRLLNFRRIEIQMRPGALIIKNQSIEASDIQAIYRKGFFKAVIGIKPKNTLLVPYKFCFSFADEEAYGNSALTEWAEQHHIQVLRKRFKRWI